MPGYDGTGPRGTGPVGRGLGPCGRGAARGGRGFLGFRRGFRGWGPGFAWWSQANIDEKSQLDSSKQWLTSQLEVINQRLSDLEEK